MWEETRPSNAKNVIVEPAWMVALQAPASLPRFSDVNAEASDLSSLRIAATPLGPRRLLARLREVSTLLTRRSDAMRMPSTGWKPCFGEIGLHLVVHDA